MSVAAQVHFWPWSCSSSEETKDIGSQTFFSFYGSPVISLISEASIILPARHERFHPLGPAFKPPNSNSFCRLFESPHGTVFSDMKIGTLHIHNKADNKVVQEIIRLDPKNVLPRYEGTDEQGKSMESPLSRVVEGWSSFFEDLLKDGQHDNEMNSRIEWEAVQDYLEKIQANKQEPFRALIVDIAEKMHRQLPEIVRATRRALLRERRLVSANRVEETDIGCLYWYIRQPGRTMAEKAGTRQRLLAIARQETHNLHENRILKDFLIRCNHVGKRYIANASGENPAYITSTRVQCVRLLSSLCAQLYLSPQLLDVSAPNPTTPPNYVLLNDIRYRKIWYWYQRLLRQEQEKDRFWDWQARTWADIARLLISVAIRFLQKECSGFKLTEIYQGSLRVRNEQLLGCRTAAGSETGPLLIECNEENRLSTPWVLEIVHPEQAEYHPIAKNLGATGGHLYLVLRPLGREVSPQVLIVWAVHAAASSIIPSWNDIGESAEKALTRHQSFLNMARIPLAPQLHGLVLCSSINAIKSDIGYAKNSTYLVTVPTKPGEWIMAVETIYIVLNTILEEMLI
jgi:hypothetical protein